MNDIEKAIEIIREDFKYSLGNTPLVNDVLNLAILALEKQMPKVPTRQKFGAWEVYNGLCESCLTSIRADTNYCPECGQKIDWSEAQE